jgi:acetyl-CoA acetyltransferase
MVKAKVIVGAAETERVGVVPEMSAIQLHADAARRALNDCGLGPADIDGLATARQTPVEIAHYLGIQPAWMDGTAIGGCSFLAHVRHSAGAIDAGLCSTVLVTHGQSGRSRVGEPSPAVERQSMRTQFEMVYGMDGPPNGFPIGVLRYMKEFGLTQEQLAEVAVAQRRWASSNSRAMMRDLISVDDVLASPLVAYPMHRLECCLVTDGGGALIVTSEERARQMNLTKPPVYLLGAGESCEAPMISMSEDFTTSKAFRLSSRAAFAQARLGPADIDHLMIYDAFAHLPIYGLEDLGFVDRGEAGAFIAEGHTSPGGDLPMNTNGGGLSYTHTGMYGMFAIQESVRQLRGEAEAQVPGADVSLVQGVGGLFMSAATLILGSAAATSR